MGVTPWPADFTVDEVNNSYEFINNHCDIVSHHFDDGIPYEEAFRLQPMPAAFQQEVQTRKAKTAIGKKIFLSISALNLTRREKEIIKLVADEMTNLVIGEKLFISSRTVETHRRNILLIALGIFVGRHLDASGT